MKRLTAYVPSHSDPSSSPHFIITQCITGLGIQGAVGPSVGDSGGEGGSEGGSD